MSTQEHIFLSGEGDHYFDRCHATRDEEHYIRQDHVMDVFRQMNLPDPTCILEVGCASGYRLEGFRRTFGCQTYGLDPSAKAIDSGRAAFPELSLEVGVASTLPYGDGAFDHIILGNFLGWCSRDSLFQVACETDRVLRDGGFVWIIDFETIAPYCNTYTHAPGVYTYKMNHYKMFTWHPQYTTIHQSYLNPDHYTPEAPRDSKSILRILRKDAASAFSIVDPYNTARTAHEAASRN